MDTEAKHSLHWRDIMAKINITEARVEVVCDLYLAGKDEFGHDYNAECYSIVITRLDGHRMAHDITWYGCETGTTEDGFTGFGDVRKEAKANADALVTRIEEAGIVDDAHWAEIDPAYGSDYYCEVYNF